MVWPLALLDSPPEIRVTAGYTLRQYNTSDKEAHARLMTAAGMGYCSLKYWEQHILPDGFFLLESDRDHVVVAACFASHHHSARHPRAGNLGWLAVDPAYRGHGLGRTVAAAVTTRLIRAGYRDIYLDTQDFRLAAIKLYLSMGWQPMLYNDKMLDRWRAIYNKLDVPISF